MTATAIDTLYDQHEMFGDGLHLGVNLEALALEAMVDQWLEYAINYSAHENYWWPNRWSKNRESGDSTLPYDFVVAIGQDTHLIDCKGSKNPKHPYTVTIGAKAIEEPDTIHGINFVYVTHRLKVIKYDEIEGLIKGTERKIGNGGGAYYVVDNHPDSSLYIDRNLNDWMKEIRDDRRDRS